MNRSRFSVCVYVVIACGMSAGGIACASDAPGTMPATTQSAGRDLSAIMEDVQANGQAIGAALGPAATLADKAKRDAAAARVIPALRTMGHLIDELNNAGDEGRATAGQLAPKLTQMLAIFGDQATLDRLHAQARGDDPTAAAVAAGDLTLVDWVDDGQDPAAQARLLDDLEQQAKKTPTNLELTRQLVTMGDLVPASRALHERALELASNMQTPMAEQVRSQLQADRKLHAIEGTPLAIAGTTPDGKAFTTADWKGKVILVDFWATWCGPCRAELPRVKKLYADYHSKGLEIVGVSNDQDPKALTDFVAADPDMPWPQLFDQSAAAAGQWNSITTGFGIGGIPVMFLIDKKGVCRTVDARDTMEDEIPKLLAE